MDWQEAKQQTLTKARCLVFKVGSAVLTDDQGLRLDILQSLAQQIAAVAQASQPPRRVLLVTSAAVAAGKAVLRQRGLATDGFGLAAKQAAAALGQNKIMEAWDSCFNQYGYSVAQLLLTRNDFSLRSRLLNISNTFNELFAWNIIPIINENDTVSTDELKFGDNDTLASLLVNLVGADLMVNLTSAPGVLDLKQNPPLRMECIEDIASLDLDSLCGQKTNVGSGGMLSKLLAARRTAQRGVPTLILPGREERIIARAFAGEGVGTWVCPMQHAIPTRKFWLAYKALPEGTLTIDAGAAEALTQRGKSLLPGGIVSVDGMFEKGAPVRIVYDGKILGVGLSNYDSEELLRIKGLKRIEVAALLGNAHYPEVIHRDNMLLDAAVQ